MSKIGGSDLNWQDFYLYFSLEGLHQTEAFTNETRNNSLKNDLYNAYKDADSDFSKQCN